MTSWARNLGGWHVALAIAGFLALGQAAAAEELRGESTVLAKDMVKRTVTLDGQVTLHVTEATRIADAAGRAITLAELPVAPREGPFVRLTESSTVRYVASSSGEKIVARSIRMIGRAAE